MLNQPKYLLLTILSLFAIVSSAMCAEKLTSYTSKEFGFSFQYPASWVISPSPVPNMRVKITAPDKTPTAECSVIIKRYPHAVTAKQSEIDQIFSETPTVEELEEALSQGGGVVKVLKATAGKLHLRPAHFARFQYRVESSYASGQVVMTATPGLTWSVSCSGQGDDPTKAEKNFQYWKSKINALVSSFRFK